MMDVFFYVLLLMLLSPCMAYLALIIFPGRKKQATSIANPYCGGISIIVPCHNGAMHIERKIHELLRECLHLDRPYELIIVSDGSTDRTNAILEDYAYDTNIRIYYLETRQGKANALNLGVSMAQYEGLVFSDIRQTIREGSIAQLIAHFSHPELGAVSAMLQHQRRSWMRRLINFLKLQESKTGNATGVYGALYAMRKSCYGPIPPDTILDDLLISIQVLGMGKRVAVEPRAVVVDVDIERFYSRDRTLRIINGLFQLAWVHARTIFRLPLRNILFLYFQKYFKLVFPLFILLLPMVGFWGTAFESARFQITGNILLLLGMVLLSTGLRKCRFVFRLLHFYLLSMVFPRRFNTVLWSQLE